MQHQQGYPFLEMFWFLVLRWSFHLFFLCTIFLLLLVKKNIWLTAFLFSCLFLKHSYTLERELSSSILACISAKFKGSMHQFLMLIYVLTITWNKVPATLVVTDFSHVSLPTVWTSWLNMAKPCENRSLLICGNCDVFGLTLSSNERNL